MGFSAGIEKDSVKRWIVSEDSSWTHTFSNLDEESWPSYQLYRQKWCQKATQAVDNESGPSSRNQYARSGKTKDGSEQEVEDADNQDGRPASIQKFNCTKMALRPATANDWKGAFENLDAKATGKAIIRLKKLLFPDGFGRR